MASERAPIAASVSPPFFAILPREVRDMIYTNVCGDDFLHICERPPLQATRFLCDNDLIHIVPLRPTPPKAAVPVRFQATICYAYVSEEDSQKLDGLLSYTTEYGSPHVQYNDGWWFCGGGRARLLHVPFRLDLRFLLVSRRVYDEARHVPYASSTFSFNGLRLLAGFREHLLRTATGHHLALGGIHLDIPLRHWDELTRWEEEIQQCVRDFPRLRHVSIYLRWRCDQWMPSPKRPPKIGSHVNQDPGPLLSTFLQLRKLPLQSVHFQISGRIGRQMGEQAESHPQYWTEAEMREWSRYISNSLMQKAE